MKTKLFIVLAGIFLVTAPARAGSKVTVEHRDNATATADFAFRQVPRPVSNDAASGAKIILLDGASDPNGGGLTKLNDGRLPDEPDDPTGNFFFRTGSKNQRLLLDLEHDIAIREVNTYSWHPDARGPQNYRLYAAAASTPGLDLKLPAGAPPETAGWQLLAAVNTKPGTGNVGGQYGVSIAQPDGTFGKFRYLLFDVAPNDPADNFSHTFYSEIDVIDAETPAATLTAIRSHPLFTFHTADGKCTISLDTAEAPALREWAEHTLAPVIAEWYPRITAWWPSQGYTAPDRFKITIKPMAGVAHTLGRNVTASSEWLEKHLADEALGALVHEAAHVVQQFRSRKNPGWLVEGCADYIRWFQYDADQHGADIVWMRRQGKKFSPHYNDSYRITANFLDWVSKKYAPDLVARLTAAMRQDQYHERLWVQYTGHTLTDLGEEWRQAVTAQLAP